MSLIFSYHQLIPKTACTYHRSWAHPGTLGDHTETLAPWGMSNNSAELALEEGNRDPLNQGVEQIVLIGLLKRQIGHVATSRETSATWRHDHNAPPQA